MATSHDDEAYSREAYDFFNADAVTLSPYLGLDSIEPFFTNYPDKGAYILNKTSNRSSGELQDLVVDGEPLYLRVSKKIVEWHRPGMGAVVGATYPEELLGIGGVFIDSGLEIPFFYRAAFPGGSVEAVCSALRCIPTYHPPINARAPSITRTARDRTSFRRCRGAAWPLLTTRSILLTV